MIVVFKITHNIYNAEVSPSLRYYPKSNTRGNKYKLLNHKFHYDLRKYSFSARIFFALLFLSSIFYLLSIFFSPRLIAAAAGWMSTVLWHTVWP